MSDTWEYKGRGLYLMALGFAFFFNILGFLIGLVGSLVYPARSTGRRMCVVAVIFSLLSMPLGFILYF